MFFFVLRNTTTDGLCYTFVIMVDEDIQSKITLVRPT